ncbi:MAG: hypothetical protein KC777_04030 [Cyanobacteria bacterium HKST-UBA02]|nr:hypothetical protein [Cyanobacteria bacterium HKST-UBA02]
MREHVKSLLSGDEKLSFVAVPDLGKSTNYLTETKNGIIGSFILAGFFFIMLWSKHGDPVQAAMVFIVAFVLVSSVICLNNLAFFRRQSRCIYGISDRALIILRYRQPVKDLNVVSVSHPGEFKIERIPFASISRMTVMKNKDGSGHLVYGLIHESRTMHSLLFPDVEAASQSLPDAVKLLDG